MSVAVAKTTEEFSEQRQWFEVALSSIGDGVITADTEGLVTFLNPVAESLTGWTRAEAQGQPLEKVFRIVNEDTRQEVENPALRAIREGVVIALANHTLLISKDGREIAIDDSGAPIRSGTSSVGAVLVFRDISERRQGEQARALLAGIVDSSEDAIVSKSLEGIITSWNAAAERMFGYTASEAVGKPINIIIPAEHQDEEKVILSQLRLGRRVDHFETIRVTKSGEMKNISLTVSPVRDTSGAIIGASKIARDITDRIRAEEERTRLLASESAARHHAEAANRAKDEFLAMISHEIRSPLNAILGWAQMLRLGKLDQAGMERAVESIERNARAQVQLLSDLLDISRVITGKLRIEPRPIDVLNSLEAALESIRPAADAKSIDIVVSHSHSGTIVSGDADRLQQVFWNLFSNAVKFTPTHGRIAITVERLGSHLQIEVTDSGIGIKKEFLPYVFDRFSQADTSSTREHTGLGLGLAIVRHLVELHGGIVRVHSAGEGQGTTFTIRLPVRALKEEEAGRDIAHLSVEALDSLATNIALEGLRVMIVDDEAEARDLLTMMLEGRGAEVKACASAQEALTTINEWPPSILVSDISMPGEDGYSFIKKVRNLGPENRDIPAIALTAFARPEDRMRALAAGFQMHVPKPVEAMELLMVIASLANRKTVL